MKWRSISIVQIVHIYFNLGPSLWLVTSSLRIINSARKWSINSPDGSGLISDDPYNFWRNKSRRICSSCPSTGTVICNWFKVLYKDPLDVTMCLRTLFHISGRMRGKRGPLWVATKIKKFQNADPPSPRRSPISRMQRATLGQSSDSWWLKQVIKTFMPRKATWRSVARLLLQRCCCGCVPPPLCTLSDPPRDPSPLPTPVPPPLPPPLPAVAAPDELMFFVATIRACCVEGGLRACRTTVNAKLMSDWRTRGASGEKIATLIKWANEEF